MDNNKDRNTNRKKATWYFASFHSTIVILSIMFITEIEYDGFTPWNMWGENIGLIPVMENMNDLFQHEVD